MFVFRRQVEERRRVTTTILAKTFSVTAATVTESFHKLSEKKLVEYTPYYGVRLTKKGVATAQKLLRKHRLLETLFVRFMHYNPGTACIEASKIDYYCSDDLTNKICSVYDHPIKCPCNKQIFRDQNCLGER